MADSATAGGEYAPLAAQDPPAGYGATSVRVRIARVGELPHDGEAKFSRDGSEHVTDEVFNTASHFIAAMLSLLGGVELITKASEEARHQRARGARRVARQKPWPRGVWAVARLPRRCARVARCQRHDCIAHRCPCGVLKLPPRGRRALRMRTSQAPTATTVADASPAPAHRLARAQSQPWKIVGFSIYAATLVNLFVCSTLHHGLEGPPAMERGLRIADYCAIYPLIAGTFTPICFVYLWNNGFGWALWGVLWFLAFGGIALTISAFDHLPKCALADHTPPKNASKHIV